MAERLQWQRMIWTIGDTKAGRDEYVYFGKCQYTLQNTPTLFFGNQVAAIRWDLKANGKSRPVSTSLIRRV